MTAAFTSGPNEGPTGPTSWADVPVSDVHAKYLAENAAITADAARSVGVYTVACADDLPTDFRWFRENVPGLMFPWTSPGGKVVLQYRPDDGVSGPDVRHRDKDTGKVIKYGMPKGSGSTLGVVRSVQNPKRAMIVEGTKQSLAAASHAPKDTCVYAVAGCRNWSTNAIPLTDLEVFDGLETFVVFDADVESNLDVWTAAKKLQQALKAEGASSVRWVQIPAGDKTGLDDLLASRGPERRATFLENLLDQALAKLPAKPKATSRTQDADTDEESGGFVGSFFDEKTGLLVKQLFEALRSRHPLALTSERQIAMYRGGVYDIDGAAFRGGVADLLGDRYRPTHRCAVEEFAEGVLSNEQAILPDYVDVPLLNVRNGMLDLATMTLHPHDPALFSATQLPIEWDEKATCPAYEAWAADVISGQLDDLEESAAMMLDPSRTPPKAVFLFGPSRSGKSTYLRLLQSVAGPGNYSAITLHKLVTDRFSAANVYGKILNCAADLSSAHVDDLSVFKMMTGEDPIQADRKFGKQFPFINRALFAFSANELPTVGESSRAYVERIKPFEFGNSFAGRENPKIETDMRAELPGILVRWVQAWQRMHVRGTYLPTDPRVLREFEIRSDRVRQWVDECAVVQTHTCDGRPIQHGTTVPANQASTKSDLARAFNTWAEEQRARPMGTRTVTARLLTIPGVQTVRRLPSKSEALNVTLRRPGEERETVAVWSAETATPGSETTTEGASGADETAATTPAEAESGEIRDLGGEIRDLGGGFGSEEKETFPQVSEPPTDLGGESGDLKTTVESRGGYRGSNEASSLPTTGKCVETATPATEVSILTFGAGSCLPDGVIALDIETGSKEKIWDGDSGFIRLLGYQVGDVITVTTDLTALLELLPAAKLVVGHNIMAFDLVAYALQYGVDIRALADEGRIFDTMLASIISDPPHAEGGDEKVAIGKIMRERSLDALGTAVLGVAKSGDLKGLAKEFGGFGSIPVNDERFTEYLRGDVDLTARLARTMTMSPERRAYLNREHRVAAVAAQIRMNGFRVDVDLARARHQAGLDRGKILIAELIERYQLPTEKAGGKPAKSPQSTKEGRAILVQAFKGLGVTLPLTDKGSPALGKDALAAVAEGHADNDEVLWLTERISALNGIRTVYGTALEHLHGDRVHPEILMFQASGRWSFKDPGLTVFGKNEGRHVEREIFLPEPGHVIIAADLAQVDARALAALSQDEAYLAMFAPGLDLHSEVARRAFGQPPAELTDEHDIKAWLKARRTEAKVVGHGWNYGRSVNALAKSVGIEVATEFDRSMTAAFPRLVEWRQEVRRAGERGELLDNGFGRPMTVVRDRAWTQAPALMGQGCARDLMMEGLLRLPKHVLPYLRAVVHDEVVLSVPQDQVEELEKEVVAALSFDWAPSWGEHSVRIEAGLSEGGIGGTGRGMNWGQVYEESA